MEQQTLNRLFIGMFIVMFAMVLAVAGVGLYKMAKEPIQVPSPAVVKVDQAAVAAH